MQRIIYFGPEEKPHKRDCSCFACEVANRAILRLRKLASLPKAEADRLRELYKKMDNERPLPNIRPLMASCFDKGAKNPSLGGMKNSFK